VARETNPERQALYQLAWHLGASQSDIAHLEAENIDWESQVISFVRKKTGSIAIMRFDAELAEILRGLPPAGPLFPQLRKVRAGDRATEFKQRCEGLGIKGISLHSYRYAWAERAKKAGYPERFAQEALGHNSKAVHRAYARKARVELPALSDYERQRTLFAGRCKKLSVVCSLAAPSHPLRGRWSDGERSEPSATDPAGDGNRKLIVVGGPKDACVGVFDKKHPTQAHLWPTQKTLTS